MNVKKLSYIIAFLAIIVISSCDKDESVSSQAKYGTFREQVTVENVSDTFLLGDTIWLSASINNELYDYSTQQAVDIENASFMLSGFINSLKENDDSSFFIYENFEIVEDIGEIMIVNVLNTYDQISYNFDLKFGGPYENHDLRFGLIPKFEAVFAMEFEGVAIYGPDRINYEDFSEENEKALIDFYFSNDNINDTVYYTLPYNYQQYYNNYYNSLDITNKEFYFFEVVNKNEE